MYLVFFKRLGDVIVSLLLLVILIIPMIIIAIGIKVSSNGPIFFKQQRMGKDCVLFDILKFRTMVTDAHLLGGFSTQMNDPRITPFGKFLRKWSFDEFPQFINVLLGHMSIIGPRPDVQDQKSNYSPIELRERHVVKPGLTGLSQCRNRHNLSNKNRKRYDIFYNRNLSLLLDFKIAVWTMKILIKGSY